MSADRAAVDRVAHILDAHHDHVWGRLPFLGPMAARLDRERGRPGRLTQLIMALHRLLFEHLDREDRVLLAIAGQEASPELARRAARLHAEHAVVTDLLDGIREEVGLGLGPTATAGVLQEELGDLDAHLREQIRLEEAVLAMSRGG